MRQSFFSAKFLVNARFNASVQLNKYGQPVQVLFDHKSHSAQRFQINPVNKSVTVPSPLSTYVTSGLDVAVPLQVIALHSQPRTSLTATLSHVPFR